jgi:hypothetical protein
MVTRKGRNLRTSVQGSKNRLGDIATRRLDVEKASSLSGGLFSAQLSELQSSTFILISAVFSLKIG